MRDVDLQEIFLSSLRNTPLSDLLDLRKEAETSYYMDVSPVQDSFRYRARHLGLRLAHLVIDEKGELDKGRLDELIRLLGQGSFILGPGREGDALIYGHIRTCLSQLPDMWSWIRKFSPPLCHKGAEEIVRDTLWPESIRKVETVHVRRAVVSAWFTLLRQTTGSCFATAPAILVQRNYPVQFFKDLYDLLSMGQLKRVVAGKEYSVPLNLSSGVTDLQRDVSSLSVAHAPGLRAALEAGGAAPDKFEEAPTVRKLLHSALLKSVGITEEDVADEEHLARIQMTPLLTRQSAVYYQRPSERAVKVAEWKKKLAKACTAFQAFTECALLRSWEYTLASFCDVKTDFARWNLYIGLGMNADHKGGIGAFLYAEVNEQLQKCNREIEILSGEYEQGTRSLNALELMLSNAVSETRRYQLKSELSSQVMVVNAILQARAELIAKAEAIAGFFSSLMKQYDEKLQEYFQELFDPAIFSEEAHLYDDSLAGFRLIYKHGRRDASQWSAISTGEEYINSLRDFFSAVEPDIQTPPPLGREFLSSITTALIRFVQESPFLTAALARSKEMGRRSPWDYLSGGTMETLIQSYCNRDHPFTEARVIPHSELELLRFLTKERREGPLLMHSPTHAFVYYPDALPSNAESLLRPNKTEWNELMHEHIAHKVESRLPQSEKALFLHLFKQKPRAETKMQFRQFLIEALGPRIKNPVSLIDSVLYEHSPSLSLPQAKEALASILMHLGKRQRGGKLDGTFFGAYDLYLIAKGVLLEELGSPFSFTDWDMAIADAMRHLGLLYPHPLLFADTNWSGWFFAFIVNPVTSQLELWRMNRTATQGFPMSDWKEWTSPQNTAPWIILTRPKEYEPIRKL
ncbi:MAG TPA: hypothetical protein VLF94_01050 [Chlamydiales bacterium]|nr:hypothetical protein [Chlamydiales bacterium]